MSSSLDRLDAFENELDAYVPSQFNAFNKAPDGTLILYNTLSGHSCALPARSAALFEPYLTAPAVNRPLNAVGKFLEMHGYLVPLGTNEAGRVAVMHGMQNFRSDILELVLVAHEDCDFRCVDCPRHFRPRAMQPETVERVKKLIASRAQNKLRSMSLTWIGGEPLLGYDAIAEIAPWAQELCRRHDVAYNSSIHTNAYLLTPERSRNLVGWGVTSYQIKIDGSREQHDRRRVLRDGGPTYDRIVENISAMASMEAEFRVKIRVNFDIDNTPEAEPLFSAFANRLARDGRFVFQFAPTNQWGEARDPEIPFCDEHAVDRERSIRRAAQRAGLTVEVATASLRDRNPCATAHAYNFILGVDGVVMKCWEETDEFVDNVVGELTEGGELSLDEGKLSKWIQPYYAFDLACANCFVLPLCQGARCPAARVRNQVACIPEKFDLDRLLLETWKEHAGNGGPSRPVAGGGDAPAARTETPAAV